MFPLISCVVYSLLLIAIIIAVFSAFGNEMASIVRLGLNSNKSKIVITKVNMYSVCVF